MQYLTAKEARQFAEAWLPAWTGNNPEHLGGFYSEDAFYLDPAISKGDFVQIAQNLFINDPVYLLVVGKIKWILLLQVQGVSPNHLKWCYFYYLSPRSLMGKLPLLFQNPTNGISGFC